ncbi:MAG: acetyl-CoA carboxylase carboxyl transferase subunit beta, partial [Lachnospiraceae bacterium]|nr:acetyl-CoA carboxylase carboxyl transferase subunit beta [Lachnospiraceae bacterium]
MSEVWRNRKYISIYKNKKKEKVRRFPLIAWKAAPKESKGEEKPQEERKMVVCPSCGRELDRAEVVANQYICTVCGGYFRVRTNNRIRMVCDRSTFTEWFAEVEGGNPLHFPDYDEKLAEVREKTGLLEGITVGEGAIYGERAAIGICDARFLMGSMGHAVGEKIALAVERATQERLPVIIFCCSGGARMQEGMVSLMQMAKTAAAIKKHADAGLLYVTVLTDPTTGGVTASFAMLGDIILAEPGAL